jgi:hypothetical protein
MRKITSKLVPAALVLLMAACFRENVVEIAGKRASVPFGQIERDDWKPVPVDLLLVVDGAGGMKSKQEMLARDLPVLVEGLLGGGVAGALPVGDLHVGVISPDLGIGGYEAMVTCEDVDGDDGVLLHAPGGEGCASSYPTFLSYTSDPENLPEAEAIEELSRDFGCIARIGTDGCWIEQHLEAVHRALVEQSGPGGRNEGFLRPEGILAILIVTLREDCSAMDLSVFDPDDPAFGCGYGCYYETSKLFPVSRYEEMLLSLKGADDKFALGVIAGVPQGEKACSGRGDAIGGCLDVEPMQMVPSPTTWFPRWACGFPAGCTPPDPPDMGDCDTLAKPARRLVELAGNLGGSAVVGSICTDSFVPLLEDLSSIVTGKFLALSRNPAPLFVEAAGDPSGCTCELRCALIEEPAAGETREIPQVGTKVDPCGGGCGNPDAAFSAGEGVGWWWNPTDRENPVVELKGIVPQEGSTLRVACE